jgi:hypothetical protein
MKQTFFDHIKNIYSWKTKRKIVVFCVDDYGNVRLDSKKARENLNKEGLKVISRFDAYDTLETREDLEALYETLSIVKDKDGKPAVFTPYTLPCNLDFETINTSKTDCYVPEALPDTYTKLSAKDSKAYEGVWELWTEGISNGLMKPQLHGREHLNLKVFEEKLRKKDKEVLANLKNRSYTSISTTGYPTIGYTAAFAFQDQNDFQHLQDILEDGAKQFEKVFGFKSKTFTPPAQQFPSEMMPLLKSLGIKAIDRPFFHKLHIGNSKFKREINILGKDRETDLIKLVRNVVFEPALGKTDHVKKALKQIEIAFLWNKPAIISSHRVNFCGHIDENNRKKGLEGLRTLLYEIKKRWPDVEFMAADELSQLIASNKIE